MVEGFSFFSSLLSRTSQRQPRQAASAAEKLSRSRYPMLSADTCYALCLPRLVCWSFANRILL